MTDLFRPYTVIVNQGSGCLIQPIAEDYTYVLTAKHNITKADNNLNLLQRSVANGPNNWRMEDIEFLPLVENQNYFPHAIHDVAIIKVTRLGDLELLYRTDQADAQTYYLSGYPETRRAANPQNPQRWYRCDVNLTIIGGNDGAMEAQIPGNPEKAEIDGHSGGPILFERGGNIMLLGVETQMVAAENEQLGRVQFYPLAVFDSIISKHPNELSVIAPFFMQCFSFLKGDVFELESLQADRILGVKNYLLYQAGLINRDACTPIAIKDFFKQRLLLDKQPEEVLQSKEIWRTWLEFLTIMNIVRAIPVSMLNIEDVFNSVRLLFSNSPKDWSSELINMVYSDYRGLKNKGVVIIGMSRPPGRDEYIIEEQKIPLISQARATRDRNKLQIDEGMTFPFDHYKFVHIDYFKGHTIIAQCEKWGDLKTDAEFLENLKVAYDQLFSA